MSTVSLENYLKTIYHLSDGGRSIVSTQEVSKALDYSNPAITDMAKKMKEKGLLEYTKYKGMRLSPRGTKEALRIIRIHRLWETFLMEVLGYDWQEVHEEAELLEHSTSDKLAEKLAIYLDYPERDPHGAPIPGIDGQWPAPSFDLLRFDHVVKPGIYTIQRVSDNNPEFLQIITQLGLALFTEIELVEHCSFDESKRILIRGKETFLSNKISQRIFISEAK